MQLSLTTLITLIATICVAHVSAQDGKIFYKIPDPFGTDVVRNKATGYYSIKSSQSTMSSHKKRSQFEVDEYFSFAFGLTYSLHRDKNDANNEFAIIGDGPRGKSYIIRNPSVDVGKLDCELDHVHHHRQVFPWQYVYDLKDDEASNNRTTTTNTTETDQQQEGSPAPDKKAKRNRKRDNSNKKNRRSTKRFIYGVGAIWMNAIKRGLVSKQVGDDSPYQGANVWQMYDTNLDIRLLFAKPKVEDWSQVEQAGRENLVASSLIDSIHLMRKNVIEEDDQLDGMSSGDDPMEIISLQEFNTGISVDDPILKPFFSQLAECRRQTKRHRVFPSLMRAVSLSPVRLYALQYVERKYASLMVGGKFEEKHHRVVHDTEVHTEWFSFRYETQVDVYETAGVLYSPNYPNYDRLVDIFIKRLSWGANGNRSSRHSTRHYHMVERRGNIESCKLGEADPLPQWFNLMIRKIHLRRPNGNVISGLVTGVGALIMNAAEIHYKQFNLFKTTIEVPYDASNPQVERNVLVDEWQLYHKPTERTVHFYFRSRENEGDPAPPHEIDDLLRIDVRDSKAKDSSIDVIEDASSNESDMLVRFDILSLETDKSDTEAEFMFTPPKECMGTIEESEEEGLSDEDNFHQDEDFFATDLSDDDSNGDDQNEGEDFEFEPGIFPEDFQFPDIYDYFDGRMVYKMVYAVELIGNDDDNDDGTKEPKRIHLMDLVDYEANLAKHLVFNSKQALEEMKPQVEFYIDYKSELIFRLQRDSAEGGGGGGDDDKWLIVDELDSWFRLLSAKLDYFDKTFSISNRIRSYGLGALWQAAHQSEYSYFVGMRKGSIKKNDDCEYREVVWGLEDDGDTELQYEFQFLWNATQNNLDSAVWQSRRPNELLSLNSVTITPFLDADNLDEQQQSDGEQQKSGSSVNFVGIRIPEPIEITPLEGNSFGLPEACVKLAKERELANEEADANKLDLATKIPSFWDYIYTSNTYSTVYYVSHIPKSDDSKEAKFQSISITRIAEHVDRNTSLGKLTIGSGPETREVFIDDNKKTIYSFMAATGVCKRLASLSGLIDSVTGLESIKGIDFNSGRMFGLADLWIHLSESSQVQLEKVTWHKDMDTFELTERRAYHEIIELENTAMENKIAGSPISYGLTITFRSHPGASPNIPKKFTPETIDFRPTYTKSFSGRTPIHRTTINIESITNDPSISEADLQMPDECLRLSNKDPSSGGAGGGGGGDNKPVDNSASSDLPFPRLSDILQGSPFYMRSEVTSTSSLQSGNNDRKLYIMNEWLNANGDVRLRTNGLQRDFDLLIYAATKEAFDLSTPFKCPRVLPKLYPSKGARTNSSLLEFWAGETSFVDTLSELYYGPMSLWRQAELNVANAKLISSMELTPKVDESMDDLFERLKRDSQTEVWRISSPNGSGSKWIYDMHFEFISNDKIGRQWHVLERIDIQPVDYKDIDHIEIDVINYRYEHSDGEIFDKFNLPEGYNCPRNLPVQNKMLKDGGDDLNVDWSKSHQMWYEASLELMDLSTTTLSEDPELGSLRLPGSEVLPTASGYIIKASNYDNSTDGKDVPPIDLYVHYKKSRNLNGQTISSKIVFDRITSLIYISDESVGFCSEPNEVSIEFPGFERTEYLNLDKKTVNLLFGDRKLYLPTSRYTNPIDGYSYSVYERNIDELKWQSSLEGPATIIRKFQHHPGTRMSQGFDEDNNLLRKHDSISVKILLFDTTRSRIKAILSISLLGVSNVGLTELVGHMNVAQCYNDGNAASDRQVRTYVFEYPGSETAIKTLVTTRPQSTTDRFLLMFLQASRLMATQLAGSPRLDMVTDSNRKFRITLELIEAPTAIEYASRRMVETRMSLELESKSEMRLVSTLAECSRWCDQVGCVAMTHCSDHTCRVVTPNMLHDLSGIGNQAGGLVRNDSLTASDLAKLLNKVSDPDCSNFIWMSKRPQTLKTFTNSMDRLINQGRNLIDLEQLSLLIFGSHFENSLPEKFYEIKDNLDSFNEDDGLNDIGKAAPVYKILGHNRRLNQVKFYNLIAENRLDGRLDLKIKHGHSYGDCLELCRRDPDCVLVSHCKRPTLDCHQVSGKSGDLKALAQAVEQVAVGEETDAGGTSCNVNVRDFLAEYSEFRDTQEPTSYEMRLDGYSALECAALCSRDYNNGGGSFKCLSFDSCVTQQQTTSDAQNDHGDSSEQSVASTAQSTCYLQSKHIMLDSFDRSILAPNWHSENRTQEMATCVHYSKSMLADYRQIPNKQWLGSGLEKQFVRGSSPDQCAIECQLDDQCQAFEYCFDDERQPIQSCRFIRQEGDGSPEVKDTEFEQQHLVDSHKCSIYILDHQVESYEIDEKFHIKIISAAIKGIVSGGSGFLRSTSMALLYITVAILVGSLIQIVYIKFYGYSIMVHRRLL